MSHVVTIKIPLNDKDALISACKRLGGDWKEGQARYRWYGRHMGDYKLPAGFQETEMGRCHHAASFPGCSYEVGFIEVDKLPATHPARQIVDDKGKRIYPDGSFIPMFDFYYPGGLAAVISGGSPDNADKLIQAYRIEKLKNECRKEGHKKFKEVVRDDGSIKLKVLT